MEEYIGDVKDVLWRQRMFYDIKKHFYEAKECAMMSKDVL